MIQPPDCSKWNIWLGKEIEGFSNFGEWTLFVRKFTPTFHNLGEISPFLQRHHGEKNIQRVWLCEEMLETYCGIVGTVFNAKHSFLTVSLCVNFPLTITAKDNWIRLKNAGLLDGVQIYTKIELPPEMTRKGNHVCVGEKFADEAFQFGNGRLVNPSNYSDDILIA